MGKRMNRLLLVAMALALFSPKVYAQNYSPRFDKAPDLTEFLKVATEESALKTCMPFPSLEPEAMYAGTKELKAGYVAGGPHHILVTNSPPFQAALMYPTLIGQHESQPAYA
ncbi:MAG: hypothetical protein AB7V08_08190 [Elusimicrobiales bacterium]